MQGCEWEFKKKSWNSTKNTKDGPKTQEKAHFGGISNKQKRAEISFKAELSHPCKWLVKKNKKKN